MGRRADPSQESRADGRLQVHATGTVVCSRPLRGFGCCCIPWLESPLAHQDQKHQASPALELRGDNGRPPATSACPAVWVSAFATSTLSHGVLPPQGEPAGATRESKLKPTHGAEGREPRGIPSPWSGPAWARQAGGQGSPLAAGAGTAPDSPVTLGVRDGVAAVRTGSGDASINPRPSSPGLQGEKTLYFWKQ